MGQKTGFLRMALALAALGIIFLFPTVIAPAQQDAQPRTIHNACLGNCVADVNFLHAGMGDGMAKNAYHGWFDSYYTLAGCGDPAWKTDLLFLLDVIGDSVGAPGAPTLQCWQGLMAQAARCSDSCSQYFIPDAKYAPNVRLTLDQGGPGSLEVTLDNQANLGGLPELEPNAYSRRFPLRATLQLEDGTPVLVGDSQMPSLSFPNWITRGGYSDCLDAYGADDPRCALIEGLVTPSVISTSLAFLDGVFYDLTGQVDDLSDAAGSFAQDGFVRLLSNGDRLTINQGDFAGFLWVRTHNLSTGAHTQQLIPWDARGSALTVVNQECTSWLSTCWLTGDRTETDTYVFALQGPAGRRIPGAYTVTVTADIPHEKDFSDNYASYSYDAAAGVEEGDGGEDDYAQESEIDITDLPVIDLPGPGIYPNNLLEGMPGVMYRLSVPEGIQFLFFRLVSLDGGQFSYFIRRGSVPVPDYPLIHQDYHCWQQSDAGYSGGCPFPNPAPGDYYIFVSYTQGTAFQLEVEWTTGAEAATRVAQITQTVEAGQDQEQDDEDPAGLLSEVEPNDSRPTANPWDLGGPFSGQIARAGDRDYVFLNISHPGIYTFSLAEVGPELRAKLSLVRASTGNSLASSTAPAKGAGASLSFDASPGEQYHLIVSAAAMTSGAPAQPYTLTLSGFIPDPLEPNDDLPSATPWDLAQGPLQGYFWDKTTGRADYYRFSAPPTLDGGPLRFDVTNPAPNLRIRLTLLRANGLFLGSTPYAAPGQPAALSRSLPPGEEFFLKLETLDAKTAPLPYTLSAAYEPAAPPDDPGQGGRPLRLRGLVIERGGLLPAPVRDVQIYARVGDGPPVLLATTSVLGTYSAPVNAAEGQAIRIWAVKAGLSFTPAEDTWQPGPRARSHRTVFTTAGAQLIQATLTPTASGPGQPSATPPPLIQTALATLPPRPTSAVTAALTLSPPATETTAATAVPTATPAPPSPTPPGAEAGIIITGYAWRLFPASPPAGVGGARVILSVNGVEQPAALSRIDGSYELQAPGVQPGDRLALRAENPGDSFAPLVYQWQAEAGVPAWTYDFYSAWGAIPSPSSDDQNRLFGRVTDAQGQGVSGVYVIVQMGTSDALQRLGPTDAGGYYSGSVRLPDWIMVTAWADPGGYLPARVQFFHAYAPEDREVNFWQR